MTILERGEVVRSPRPVRVPEALQSRGIKEIMIYPDPYELVAVNNAGLYGYKDFCTYVSGKSINNHPLLQETGLTWEPNTK